MNLRINVVILLSRSVCVADKCEDSAALIIEDILIFYTFKVSFFLSHEVKLLYTFSAVISVGCCQRYIAVESEFPCCLRKYYCSVFIVIDLKAKNRSVIYRVSSLRSRILLFDAGYIPLLFLCSHLQL